MTQRKNKLDTSFGKGKMLSDLFDKGDDEADGRLDRLGDTVEAFRPLLPPEEKQ